MSDPAARLNEALQGRYIVERQLGEGGLWGALPTGPVLAGVLFDVPPRDPAILAAVLGLAAVGSILAAWLPALRASRVDPARSRTPIIRASPGSPTESNFRLVPDGV
jgi:hypothetical protein